MAEIEELNNTGNDYALVEDKSSALLKELEAGKSEDIKCRILLALTKSLIERGLSKDALQYSLEAILTSAKLNDKELQAKALNNIGVNYRILCDYSLALDYFNKALIINHEIDDKIGIANNLNNLGITYKNISDYQPALDYFNKALFINEEIGDISGQARNINNIGNAYSSLCNYSLALEYYSKAVIIYEKLNNRLGMSINFNNIGIVYMNLCEYPRAIEYYLKALKINEELDDKSGQASNYGNIGYVYSHLKDYSQALDYFNKALEVYNILGDKGGRALNIGNIGYVYANTCEYSLAYKYLTEALAIFEELGVKRWIASSLGSIGELYAKEDYERYNLLKAEEYLLKSASMLEELGAKQELYEFIEELANLCAKQSRWQEYGEYLKKYYELKQEVQSEEAKKQAERFDFERKRAEQEKQIAVARARAEAVEQVLHNTLPPSIAERLINKETFIADHYSEVSILFMDLVNFTRIASIVPPKHLIYLLNTIFSAADSVMERWGLEKIKTIGDAYMAVCGAPVPQSDHASRAARAAIDLLDAMNSLEVRMPSSLGDTSWLHDAGELSVRIGLHCGEAVGGVIGDKKFTFDLWGDSVNTAARMESFGAAGKIHCSSAFKSRAGSSAAYNYIERGILDIKGKGKLTTYFIEKNSNTGAIKK